MVSLVCAPLFGAKKKDKGDPRHPYASAELATAPVVNVADLAYRAILFEDVVVPEKWEAKARKLVDTTRDTAIDRMNSTHAFTLVGKKAGQSAMPEEPYLVVKCNLVDYRIVGKGSRFLVGVAAGSSYVTFHVEIYDGKTNALYSSWQLATQNNAFVGMFTNNDSKLFEYLGNSFGDFMSLRARKDKGADVVPMEDPGPGKKK
jgi:hypothetical protein